MRHFVSLGILFAITMAAALGFVWVRSVERPIVRHPTTGQYSIIEPDGFLRWRLVERARAGEDPRIRWIHDENAPHGRINEWTSPTTYLGMALGRSVELMGYSKSEASTLASHWLGVALGLVGLCAMAIFGYLSGGVPLAAAWVVSWPALTDVVAITRFGNPDHHSLHQMLFIGMIGSMLAASKSTTAVLGCIGGIFGGLALWSAGSEMLPAVLLTAGLMGYELLVEKPAMERRRFWRAWWRAGFITTATAWLFEFWPHPFHNQIEMLSLWHVLLWLLAGLVAELGPSRSPRFRIGLACAATGLALLIAIAMRGFDVEHLHIVQDPRFQRQMQVTREFAPLFSGWKGSGTLVWSTAALLPIFALWGLGTFARHPLRIRWLMLVFFAFLALTVQQMRWLDFLIPSLVMVAGYGAMHIVGRRRWLAPLLLLLATLPLWQQPLAIAKNIRLVHGDSRLGPHRELFVLQSISTCLTTGHKPVVVLAPWDCGAALAVHGSVHVISSAYWSNLAGTADGCRAFATASPKEFQKIVNQRGVDYLVLPPQDRLARAISQSWIMANGLPPTWEELQQAVVWKIAMRPSDERDVPCPDAMKIEPGWRIIKLTATPPDPR